MQKTIKLMDLLPKFLAEKDRVGQGIEFECPLAYKSNENLKNKEHCRIKVYFSNPIDGGFPVKDEKLFLSKGDSLCRMSVIANIEHSCKHGNWKGSINNGVLVY